MNNNAYLLQVADIKRMTTKNKIPVTLNADSEVRISLYDLSGIRVASIVRTSLGTGDHEISVDSLSLGIPAGDYVYQAEIKVGSEVTKHRKMVAVS